MNAYGLAGDQCAVRTTAPRPVHVEAMRQRGTQLDVVSGHVAGADSTGAGNGVPVEVEQVALDHRRGLIVANTVAQTLVLAVVDEIMVNVVAVTIDKENGALTECGEVAIVHLEAGMYGLDTFGDGELIVIGAAAGFSVRKPFPNRELGECLVCFSISGYRVWRCLSVCP